MRSIIFALIVSCLPIACSVAGDGTLPVIVDVQRIWDKAPHNAFTDLIRFKDRWYCTFREGSGHASDDGVLKVIASDDGSKWESVASFKSLRGFDMREAKFSIMPDGRLMLVGAEANRNVKPTQHQSLVWFTADGKDWSKQVAIADQDFWLWRGMWQKGKGYFFGYRTLRNPGAIRLYTTSDGKDFKTLASDVFETSEKGFPNETSLAFLEDGTCYCLLRRDGGRDLNSAQFGTALPPYTDWKWQDMGVRIGGPSMIRLPDGRWVSVIRRYGNKKRQQRSDWYTSLHWLDPEKATLTEVLKLPSDGDCSYAGLVFHDGLLWISYYSSHEEKTSVYLAKVRFDGAPSGSLQKEQP